MNRLFIALRIAFEGILGFAILLLLPFVAIQILHSGGSVSHLLFAFFIATIVFVLGIILCRDAFILRLRLQRNK